MRDDKITYFVMVPADTPHGPIKGAYALANILAKYRKVYLITVKHGLSAHSHLDPRVRKLCLSDGGHSFIARFLLYRKLLQSAGGREHVKSISMCLSADLINGLCGKYAKTCVSVRGNLFENYGFDYGIIGKVLAFLHLNYLCRFDVVIAMNKVMANQIQEIIKKQPVVIGNFIDESSAPKVRPPSKPSNIINIIFVGTLSERKQPGSLLFAVSQLIGQGYKINARIAGIGPQEKQLRSDIDRLGLNENVSLCGFLNDPMKFLIDADVMVLPSLSEGVPRSALEALYVGVPVVLRDVDGNDELIAEGINGALFKINEELPDAILRAAAICRYKNKRRRNLIPEFCRQNHAGMKYIDLMEDEMNVSILSGGKKL